MSSPPAEVVVRCLEAALAELVAAEDDLGALDAIAGDGDHGTGVVRGMRAAVVAARARSGAGAEADGAAPSLLEVAGDAFADAAGGSSGALYGTACWVLGEQLRLGAPPPAAVDAALTAVMELGRAGPGDKTFIDALAPFAAALGDGVRPDGGHVSRLRRALAAAEEGAAATASMVARRGRAAPFGERTLGTVDPGALSTVHILRAVVEVLEDDG
jgi:dihydroxyacetone kinase